MDAQKLFQGACDFMLGVAALSQLPETDLSEVAFAGRSNVGKSSLINALTGRRTLAKTSNTPGRTQQLNFFNIGDQLILVDMPGYGYAKVSKTQKEDWNRLIRGYLRKRPNLRCVFILVDARHGLKDTDRELMKMLDETAMPYRVIFTKADKVKTQDLEKVSNETTEELKNYAAAYPETLMTSSEKKAGFEELREVVASYI